MLWPSQQQGQQQGQQHGQSQQYGQQHGQSQQQQGQQHAQSHPGQTHPSQPQHPTQPGQPQQGQYPSPAYQGQQSRPGGTVYGAQEAGPSSGPPANTGDPYGTPGLRNVGGPASNQVYYPHQQQPAFQTPNPVESSGSLTGHILSQGRADTPTPTSRTAKVVIILVVVLVVMVGLGLLAATLFNDMISDLLGGALG